MNPIRPSILTTLMLALASAVFLSACAAAPLESWAGLTLDGDTLYVPLTPTNNRNRMYMAALDLTTQEADWFFPAEAEPETMLAAPALGDGFLVLTSYDSKVYAVNNNGTLRWEAEIDRSRVIAPALVTDSAVYVAASSGTLYALNPDTGSIRWQFTDTQNALWAAPLLHNDTLYQAGIDHFLYAINPTDGSLLWKVELKGALADTPIVFNDTLIISGLTDRVYALNPSDGSVIWEYETQPDGWVWATPTLVEDILYFADLRGGVYSLDAGSGEELWRVNFPSGIRSAPAHDDGRLFIGREDGILMALSADNGTEIWQVEVDSRNADRLIGPLVVYNDWVLLMPLNARITTLYAFTTRSGDLAWSYPVNDN